MREPIRKFIERGALNEALCALAESLGRPRLSPDDFNLEFDGRHDLLWDGPQDPGLRRRALGIIRQARRNLPRDCDLWVLEGAVNGAFRKFVEAKKALSCCPPSQAARLWSFQTTAYEALCTKDTQLLALAQRQSEQLLRDNPDSFFVHAWRCKLHTGFDIHENALSDLAEMLRLDPKCGWAYAERADIHTEHRRLRSALEACNRLIELYPGQGWAYTIRGRSWGKCGRLKESLLDLDRGIAMGPALGSMHAWRGEARRQSGDLDGALQDFGAAEKLDPGYPLTYLWRGALQLRQSRYEEAAADLTRSIRLDPPNRLGFAWRGEALIKMGRLRDGLRDLDAFYPSSPRETWTGGPNAFWQDLQDLSARYPRQPLARAMRGRFLLENPSAPIDRIFEDLDASVVALPRDGWCRAWRAEAFRRLGRLDKALMDLNLAVKLKSRWPWAWAWRGRVKLETGNAPGAALDLSACLRLDPTLGEVYAWRSEALRRKGDFDQARRDKDRARALGYREPSSGSPAAPKKAAQAPEPVA